MDKAFIEQVIGQAAGVDVLKLITYLKNKENVSEFVIAKALKQEINITRNQLYRLLDHNLIEFTRKKDKEKGWYIYYWTLKLDNVGQVFWDMKKKKLSGLKDRMMREKNNFFFFCTNSCIRLDFDTAITFNYRCPECGDILVQQDNSKVMTDLSQLIADMEEEIAKAKLPPQTDVKKKTAKKVKKK